MAAQAKVVIKGQNDIGPAIKAAVGDLSSLKGAADKLGSTLKAAFTVTAIIAATKKLGDAMKDCFGEFSAADRTYRQLALALGDSYAFERAKTLIDDLGKQTLASKGDIEEMVTQLAAMGKSVDEIEAITTASVHLSNVTGKDLNTSMSSLMATYDGSTTRLRRLGIDLSGVTAEQLAQGAAIELVTEKLGDYSKMMAAEDSSQHLANIKNTWSDIKLQIGGIIDYNWAPMLGRLDTAFGGIKENLTSIINYVGAVIKNLPEAFRLTMATVWEMIKRTFEWDSIKLIITTAVTNAGIVISAMLKAVFETIPAMLGAIFNGVVQWLSYIATNLEASFLGSIQNVIDKAGSKVQGTWVGKVFGLSDKLASIDLGAEGVRSNAQGYKDAADRSFESLGPLFKDAVTDAIETVATVGLNTADMLVTLYGDIGLDFKTALDEIVAPDLASIASKADATNQEQILGVIAESSTSTALAVESIEGSTESIEKHTKTRLADQIGSWIEGKLTSLLEGPLSKLEGGLGGMLGIEFGGGIASLVAAIQPLIDVLFNTLTPFGILLTIIEGFVSIMEPALTTVFAPLVDVFTWIGETLARATLPLLEGLHTAFSTVASIIMAVLSPILQTLSPIFQVFGSIIEAISPILMLVAKAFTILAAPVQFVADLFTWLGSWINYLGTVISTAIYNITHPFSKKRSYGSSPGSFSSSAFSGLGDRLAALDALSLPNTTVTDSVATSTAVSGAAYQGATQVTINIYQQAPVVGDGGMRNFARMILGEFEQLNYYGITH